MIYATLAGKVYRFTPDRWRRFLWKWSTTGAMPDLEKAGKFVGLGVLRLDKWNVQTAKDALVEIITSPKSAIQLDDAIGRQT